ncbi:hypothetical protein NW768_010700 [Fusarium equiseti]|uniref:RanBP2-type domain-containing protein n=1 Tax=Fusarium equiseti TaxID=61235 RepID=A0ABQ8QZJ9_FUSEQ|nr:hypothetical protein NW768_010700 [Fusarium equiseti]
MGLQTKRRQDHTMWRCNGKMLNQICGAVTDVKESECSKCGKRRAANDEALSNGTNVIGTLHSVGSQGEETWNYTGPEPHKKT